MASWEEQRKQREEEEIARFIAKAKLFGVAIVAFFLTIMFFSSFFTIGERERGVVLRWGKFSSVAGPGLHFKLPMITSVVKLKIDNQLTQEEKMSSGSADQQEAHMRASVNWRINPANLQAFYAQFGSLENAELAYVKPRIPARVKVVFGQFTAARTFSERAALNARAAADLQTSLGDLFIVDGLQIEDVDFGGKYMASIAERMTAEVEVAKRTQELAKEKVSAQIQNTQADAKAYQVKAEADAQAHAIREKGAAEAAAIEAKTKALEKSQNLVALTWAQQWDGHSMPNILVQGNGTNALPFLPLSQGENGKTPNYPLQSR